MAEENEQIREQLPDLEKTIEELENEIEKEKLKTRVCTVYNNWRRKFEKVTLNLYLYLFSSK